MDGWIPGRGKDAELTLKARTKHAISRAYDLAGRAVGRRPAMTILYYHAVPGDAVDRFDAQMRRLKTVARVVAPDFTGEADPARPTVAVTFDDAFRSVREHALPVLQRHGVQATIFAPTGWLGRPPGWAMESASDAEETVMSPEELASLPTDLISIGSHTVDHPRLSQLNEDQIEDQLAKSRAALEALTGRPVDQLAFPYGDHDGRVIDVARRVGYRFVYTVAPQRISPRDAAISRGRTSVDPTETLDSFDLKLRGAYAWMPLASRIKRTLSLRT
jgi:peptidoglycan/xylan/chitin deacetylase (PgdA/CDA1 family)